MHVPGVFLSLCITKQRPYFIQKDSAPWSSILWIFPIKRHLHKVLTTRDRIGFVLFIPLSAKLTFAFSLAEVSLIS